MLGSAGAARGLRPERAASSPASSPSSLAGVTALPSGAGPPRPVRPPDLGTCAGDAANSQERFTRVGAIFRLRTASVWRLEHRAGRRSRSMPSGTRRIVLGGRCPQIAPTPYLGLDGLHRGPRPVWGMLEDDPVRSGAPAALLLARSACQLRLPFAAG